MQIKSQNISVHFSKLFFGFILDILFFPVWWYSFGLIAVVRGLFYFLIFQWKALAIDVWFKNLFVPMYGMRDVASYIISFFMRMFQIIVRSFAFVLIIFLLLALLIIWISLPIFVEYAIYLQLF